MCWCMLVYHHPACVADLVTSPHLSTRVLHYGLQMRVPHCPNQLAPRPLSGVCQVRWLEHSVMPSYAIEWHTSLATVTAALVVVHRVGLRQAAD